ncbi:lipase 3-like [Ctenocephalides felis]|uniref:lipase 3-like n=1 Tax=Ctenocephalides felis TaxID=7515 RepID=UPI000E6E3C47|nr:lipase 3-like [Ctenocephalides felis]
MLLKLFNVLTIALLINFVNVQQVFDNGYSMEKETPISVEDLILQQRYPLEVHTTRTKDGYFLKMHRISHSKRSPERGNKPAVLLMHGLMLSSADWVLMGAEKGLGYILADAGYDVWMGNARGNIHSREHEVYNPNAPEYWQFSWHEMGVYDLPAMIDHILNVTGETGVHYVGYSQGCTVFFVMGAERPEYNKKIRSMQALGPAAFLSNTTSPVIRFSLPMMDTLEWASDWLGMHEFMPNWAMKFISTMGKMFCDDQSLTQDLCLQVFFSSGAFTSKHLNSTMLPKILSYMPAGASVRQMLHFGQPDIIKRHGYPAEAHVVQTEDGYLLTVHRIRCGNSRQPVLLQHGLLGCSADWIIPGPEKALAYRLADSGYDVWLGNARGNTYSKNHVSYSVEDDNFWEFSWHEMGYYDIPAVVDYINKVRNMEGRLLYVGHSMGTTMAFVMLSSRPEFNSKLKAAFTLAPVAYMGHVKSPIRLLAPMSRNLEFIIRLLGANQFLPQNKLLKLLAKYGCEATRAEKIICENTVFIFCGFDAAQFNSTLLPVIIGHTPAGTSTKTVIHYAQEINSGGWFRHYDYGVAENRRRYNQATPPPYNLSAITLPIALHYSDNDWLAGPQDVKRLYGQLGESAMGMFRVPFKQFNHIDFLWGMDAPTLLYDTLLKQMREYK